MTSVSTQGDESPDTADGDGTASVGSEPEEETDRRGGSDDRRDPTAATDELAVPDASGASSDGGASVRTRLVESTVVAAITGVFVVLGGSAQIAPRLSLPVALAGVLWLFVRTLPSMRRRAGDAPENETSAPDGGTSAAGVETTDLHPSARPVGTDRRLKMKIAEHGGRMMQKELVEAVDLSESAVSRRLSKLEEGDEVGRVCLGRENLVYLEGSRPEGADSPFPER